MLENIDGISLNLWEYLNDESKEEFVNLLVENEEIVEKFVEYKIVYDAFCDLYDIEDKE